MDTSRRNFIKIGGLCALGLSSLEVADAFAKSQATQFLTTPRPRTAKTMGHGDRYEKVLERERRLHGMHRRLQLGTQCSGHPREEAGGQVAMERKVRKRLSRPGKRYGTRRGERKALHGSLQPLPERSLRAGVPTQATFQERRGNHDDGLCTAASAAGTAWLPARTGREASTWRDPRPFIKKINPAYPTQGTRRCGEVQLLRGAARSREDPGLRRGVQIEGADFR